MEVSTILRFEVLKKIDSGDPFDLIFITADRKRGTGGDLKEVRGYKKVKGEQKEFQAVGDYKKVVTSPKVNPKHSEHKTINIYNPANTSDHVISIHWRLMVFFNKQRIIG